LRILKNELPNLGDKLPKENPCQHLELVEVELITLLDTLSRNGTMTVELLNIDCMEYMKGLDDNAFDLAIVDPPYGIKINMNQGRRKGDEIKHARKAWDNDAPKEDYWAELCRVSLERIVWGANNFSWIPPHNGWVVWNKDITGNVGFSKAELAYCSSINAVDMVKIRAQSGKETYSSKIHPTQKPKALYNWLLAKYAKPDQRILDTHLGSGSSAIAAHYFGCDFVGCELDEDYYKAAKHRFDTETAQKALF